MKKINLLKNGVALAALCCALLTVASGCGKKTPDGMPPLVPCTVSLVQDGQPLVDATVTLVSEGLTWAVSGTTDASGDAKIFTHGTYPGAPEGSYVVVVSKQIVEEPKEEDLSPSSVVSGGTAYNCVEAEYGSKDTSPLKLDVSGKTKASFDVGAAIHEPVKAL